jgi:hypothetical protein
LVATSQQNNQILSCQLDFNVKVLEKNDKKVYLIENKIQSRFYGMPKEKIEFYVKEPLAGTNIKYQLLTLGENAEEKKFLSSK